MRTATTIAAAIAFAATGAAARPSVLGRSNTLLPSREALMTARAAAGRTSGAEEGELRTFVTPNSLWPNPVNASFPAPGQFVPVDNVNFNIVLPNPVSSLLTAAATRYRSQYLFNWPDPPTDAPAGALSTLTVQVGSPQNESMPLGVDESYSLFVRLSPPTATLSSATIWGAMRGLETFSQLVQFNFTSGVYVITAAEIVDYPKLAYRGVMVDCARRFLHLETLKTIVDMMSFHKLNVLHLHLVDTDSWSTNFTSAPNLIRDAYAPSHYHAYNPSDLAELSLHALQRGVQVVPEIDTPGHSWSICVGYPNVCVEYKDPNSGNLTRGVLPDPTNEAFWTLLESLAGELFGPTMLPTSTMFHLGMDEVDLTQWSEAPTVQQFMTANNYSLTDVLHYYERRVIAIARAQGRLSIGWYPGLDSWPEGFAQNQTYAAYPDVLLNVWVGFATGSWQDTLTQLTAQNASVLLSGPFYLVDCRRADFEPSPTWAQMYDTDPLNFTGTPAMKERMFGAELTVWGDSARADSGNVFTVLHPYLGMVGESWWSPQIQQPPPSGDYPFVARYADHRCRTLRRGYTSEAQAGDDIWNHHCLVEFPMVPVNTSSVTNH